MAPTPPRKWMLRKNSILKLNAPTSFPFWDVELGGCPLSQLRWGPHSASLPCPHLQDFAQVFYTRKLRIGGGWAPSTGSESAGGRGS
ncbi:hypothetical protein A6R68_04563 [Neotoma lepida]|uniref:Uncharacterized protein n=1 Tax=Neotoma lepida TaxID=56216 RepID=A0A1A6GM01_NEOLE|nr:hypothetical protein A6R68_04563 [Neotoma lepida]